MKEDVLIIGCGEIGASLIEGWLNKKKEFYKKINHIYVLEKNLKRKKFLQKNFKNKISFVNLDNIKKEFRYIFLSIKPKDLNLNLTKYKIFFNNKTILFSVLAGKMIKDIKKVFLINKNIFRLMLNTPISVNKGTITYSSLKKFNKNDLFLISLLGNTYHLQSERYFNLITTIVGSGPAYFYYLLESLHSVAKSKGLNKNFSEKIIKDTYVGTAEIINNSKLSFDSLRKKVASRGGTTEAAINCLKKNSFQKLIYSSVNHSIKKAKNLGSKKVK